MTQLDDSIDTRTLFGDFDLTDLVCCCLFFCYASLGAIYSYQAITESHMKYKRLVTKKHYNLFNLIFNDSDFEHSQTKEDLVVMRFSSLVVLFVSIFILGFLFMPPRDEMLQFINQSGLLNIYLIMVSFLLAPVDELDYIRYLAQIEAMKLQSKMY